MDKVLRPERFEAKPDSVSANKEWLHWRQTLDNFDPVYTRVLYPDKFLSCLRCTG